MESIDQKNYNKKCQYLTSWFITIFILKIITIFFIVTPSINDFFYNFYIKITEKSLIPYKDFYFEYPPLFALFSSFPFGLIKFKNSHQYISYFQFFMLIFDIIAMKTSLKILAKLNNDKLEEIKQKKFYLTWSILSLIISIYIYQSLEYVVIYIFVLNILFFNLSKNKHNLMFYLLSIFGIFTKIISSLNLPLAIIFHSYKKSKNFSQFIFITLRNSLFLASLVILITLFFEYLFDFKMIKNLTLQYFRETEVFSLAGNYIFIINKILGTKSEIFLSLSISIEPNLYSNAFLMRHLFKIIYFLFIFITFIILAISKLKNKEILIDLLFFIEGSATIILIFLSFHNVLSPQFIGYLIPLLSILGIHYRSKKLLFFSLIIFILTPLIFPLLVTNLINEDILMLLILTIRNLTILFTCFYFIFKFYQKLLKPLKY